MKLSISDFFDGYLGESPDLSPVQPVSAENVKALVRQKLPETGKKKSRSPRRWRRLPVLAAAMVLLVAVCTGAGIYVQRTDGIQSTDELSDWEVNRLLYEANHNGQIEIVSPDGTHYLDLDGDGETETIMTDEEYNAYHDQINEEYMNELATASAVLDMDGLNTMEFLPGYVGDFPINEDGTIPGFAFGNADMAIFTQADSSGWTLKAGDSISISLKFSAKLPANLYLICDNAVIETQDAPKDANGKSRKSYTISFTAPADGEYYLAIMNTGSDEVALKRGEITVESAS